MGTARHNTHAHANPRTLSDTLTYTYPGPVGKQSGACSLAEEFFCVVPIFLLILLIISLEHSTEERRLLLFLQRNADRHADTQREDRVARENKCRGEECS